MNDIETWKNIEGYEGLYQISDMGNVKNLISGKILKPFSDEKGYLRVNLFKDKKGKTFRVHRLVAQAFIPNPNNKATVDHINTIKNDNRVSNLRWFTQKEQMADNELTNKKIKANASKVGKHIGKKNVSRAFESNKKKVICLNTGEEFNSAKEADEYYNLSKGSVSCAANPNDSRKTAGKLPDGTPLKWKYAD